VSAIASRLAQAGWLRANETTLEGLERLIASASLQYRDHRALGTLEAIKGDLVDCGAMSPEEEIGTGCAPALRARG